MLKTKAKASRDETAVETRATHRSAYDPENHSDVLLEDLYRDCGPCDSPSDYALSNVEVHTCGL